MARTAFRKDRTHPNTYNVYIPQYIMGSAMLLKEYLDVMAEQLDSHFGYGHKPLELQWCIRSLNWFMTDARKFAIETPEDIKWIK